MGKIIFLKCEAEGCNNSYPVPTDMMGILTKCPACDPKGHSKFKKETNQKKMMSNTAVRQVTHDFGKVQSLEEGGVILEDTPGVEVEHVPAEREPYDVPGVEVEHVPAEREPYVSSSKLVIPVITASEAKDQAKKAVKVDNMAKARAAKAAKKASK